MSLTAALALSLPLTAGAASNTADSTKATEKKDSAAQKGGGLSTTLKDLDAKLDSVFTDTFHNFGDWFNDSKMAASFDLRDQKDKYVARIYLPNNDDTANVKARVENGALHVTAGDEQMKNGTTSSTRFEQIIGLPGPVASDKMHIDRKRNLVVVILPKADETAATAQTSPPTPSEPTSDWNAWDQSIVNQIARMQGRMDQMLQEAFPRNLTNPSLTSNLGSAINLDEQKDKYVVRFYLPDRDLANVNVKFANGQLDLTAQQKNTHETDNGTMSSASRYEQMVTLPGPVNDEQMKVDRKGSTIVVTLPKAGESSAS